MSAPSGSDGHERADADSRPRAGRPWIGASVALAVVVGVLVLVPALLREDLPPFDAAILEQHLETWSARGIRDYEVRVVKRADRLPEETFDVRVRDGVVEEVRLDGENLPRVTDAYTIDGLFDMMRRELEMASHSGGSNDGAREGASLAASFEPELGIPLRFRALAGQGASFVIGVERLATPGGVLYSRSEDD